MPHRAAVKYGRYSLHLFRIFRWRLLLLILIVLLGGAQIAFSLRMPYGRACYAIFMLLFVQPTLDFPAQWYNQLLFFLVPVLGLGAVADSVVRLGYLVFSSKRKLQEWWIMEASTCRNHIVICGLGRSGYRIAKELLLLGEKFVMIELHPESEFVEEILDAGVPVLFGDARQKKMLEKAQTAHATAIIAATESDLTNLDAGLTARELNPEIKVVMRLFDDTLASKVASTFRLEAISTSRVSAPAFGAAATGRNVLHGFHLDGKLIHVVDLKLGKLAGRTVADLKKDFGVAVMLHGRAGDHDFGPNLNRTLAAGEIVVIVGPDEEIQKLEAANRADS